MTPRLSRLRPSATLPTSHAPRTISSRVQPRGPVVADAAVMRSALTGPGSVGRDQDGASNGLTTPTMLPFTPFASPSGYSVPIRLLLPEKFPEMSIPLVAVAFPATIAAGMAGMPPGVLLTAVALGVVRVSWGILLFEAAMARFREQLASLRS